MIGVGTIVGYAAQGALEGYEFLGPVGAAGGGALAGGLAALGYGAYFDNLNQQIGQAFYSDLQLLQDNLAPPM